MVLLTWGESPKFEKQFAFVWFCQLGGSLVFLPTEAPSLAEGPIEREVRQSLITLSELAHYQFAGFSVENLANSQLLQNRGPTLRDKGMYRFHSGSAESVHKSYHKSYSERITYANRLAWRDYVQQQLNQGGDKLLQLISEQEKAFLNVDWASHAGSGGTPSAFLNRQFNKLVSYWNNDSLVPDDKQQIAEELLYLRTEVLSNPEITPFTKHAFDVAFNSCKKDTKGI